MIEQLTNGSRMKNNLGITLVALVITIIVLLILAGVTSATLMGNNGLINRAKEAKIATEIASIKEEIQTEILGKQTENQGNISGGDLEKILLTYGKLSEEKNLIDKTLTTTKGNYEIKVSDIFKGTTVKDTPLKPYALAEIIGGANSPNISGFNVENTYYVTWGTTAPYQINETSTINNAPPSGWSNYNGKEWANIKTTGGENDCYWVWIPRYAYKVPTKGNTAQTIEIAFLKDTGSTIDDVIDENKKTEIETAGGFKTTPIPGNWVIHPAFTNAGNGGLGNLTGIWVAKYEASSNSSTVVENPTVEQLAIDGGSDNDTDLKVRVKPNVTSWRGITVGNIFKVCQNLTLTGNSLADTTNIDSHMMKNTEWGAVAYLSRSVYGKNGQVYNNPYYNNTTNYSPITGLCGNEADYTTTTYNDTNIYKYNTAEGVNASTTGNVYGIYDMAGGAWEYVAGILSSKKANSTYYDFSSIYTKYYDSYDSYDNTKYGDALYETSTSSGGITSWDTDHSDFVNSTYPVFGRGGHALDGSSGGVFSFNYYTGDTSTKDGFRPCLVSPKQ